MAAWMQGSGSRAPFLKLPLPFSHSISPFLSLLPFPHPLLLPFLFLFLLPCCVILGNGDVFSGLGYEFFLK